MPTIYLFSFPDLTDLNLFTTIFGGRLVFIQTDAYNSNRRSKTINKN